MDIIKDLNSQIDKLLLQIKIIQDECSHPKICLTKVHKGNTGNYDPSDNCYWTEFKCGLCQKQWHEDGSK